MECKLMQVVPVGESGFLVIGEVLHFYFADGIWQDGYINTDELNVIGCWSGYNYIRNGETFQI